jgi:hypothetical protein
MHYFTRAREAITAKQKSFSNGTHCVIINRTAVGSGNGGGKEGWINYVGIKCGEELDGGAGSLNYQGRCLFDKAM